MPSVDSSPVHRRVSIERHAPERGRPELLALSCGCSCCCCCCVHSLSSVVGAALGGLSLAGDDASKAAARAAVKTYWRVLAILGLVAIALGLFGGVQGLEISAFAAFFFLPFLQLLASAIAALLWVQRKPVHLRAALAALGRVTWIGLACALPGLLFMVVLAVVVSR
jgi:hypothetical protein